VMFQVRVVQNTDVSGEGGPDIVMFQVRVVRALWCFS